MPDPWVQGDDLKEHEEAVASHPLTEEAKALQGQEEDLAKQIEERREQYAEESPDFDPTGVRPAAQTGYSQAVASGDQGPLGEGIGPEPAGNLDSTQPTQEEVEKAQAQQEKAASRRRSARNES